MRFIGVCAITTVSVLAACGVAGSASDSESASAAARDRETESGPPPQCIVARGVDGVTTTGEIRDESGEATVRVTGEGCARSLTIDSTATRRDDLPAGPRTLVERAEWPSVQTKNPMFDALYQLALTESEENAVDQIRDWGFHNGQPVSCGVGGCFETGRKWNYVWTRDTAYAVDLGLGWFDPLRVKNSLEFKLSPPREGGPLMIVQDTGSGGSYPVSSDRVVWSIGARTALLHLAGAELDAFRSKASEAIAATIAHDREVVFDASDGLYRGEQSFLDWRTQTYPEWAMPDLAHIAMSKALSTNVAHLSLLEAGTELAEQSAGGSRSPWGPEALRLGAMATALRARIRERFWLPEDRQFATFVSTELDPAPTRRFDLLGTSLAILHDVATPEQARAALSSYPVLPKGPPVVFPQQQDVPIYHNRAIWPFVTAYYAKAAKKVGHAPAADNAIDSLVRGAALNLSNMENLEVVTGRAWLDDGPASGPVVNSQRQLWSVAGYLGMVNEIVFGLEARRDGVKVAPFVTTKARHDLFGGSHTIALNNARLRGKQISVVVNLPPDSGEGPSRVLPIARVRLNGITFDGGILPESALRDRNLVEVDLAPAPSDAPVDSIHLIRDASDYRVLFAPRTPRITRVALASGKLEIGLDLAGESGVTANIYRDGVRVASGLSASTTSWVDNSTSASSPSHCYTVETSFSVSGNTSYRANPACFWGSGSDRVASIGATSFEVEGGTGVTEYGRYFFRGWGGKGHTITATFTAKHSGPHLLEATYGNGGPTDTGITCAVKRVDVEEIDGGASGGSGYLVMPQRGSWASWGSSSFVRADLVRGRTYRIRITHDDRSGNMSELEHFSVYTAGLGGANGAFQGVNIAELKILALRH